MNHSELLNVVTPELRRGEIVDWVERPRPSARARSKLTTFLFGLPFFGFAIFWTHGALQSGNTYFPLFGIPFLLVGAGMVLSPVWAFIEAKYWLFYAITNQRALIIRTFPRRKVETFAPEDITRLERTTSSDGSGNIFFADELHHGRNGPYRVKRGFYGIPEAKRVEEAILELKKAVATS
jgi:hypothetical protein